MTESASELDRELTELTVRLLSLGQDLVTAKLRLEAAARAGWIAMARARYGSPFGAEIDVEVASLVAFLTNL